MIPTDLRASLFHKPWHRFVNGAEEDVPPYGVMFVSSTSSRNGDLVYTTAKPDDSAPSVVLVNGPFTVTPGREGICSFLTHGGYVLYDSSDGTPAVGDNYGPQADEWSLKKNNTGFVVTAGDATVAGQTIVSAIQFAPPASSVVPAIFTGHVAPTSPTVDYPGLTDTCRKFPAYLLPSLTFDDNTAGGSYHCWANATGKDEADYGEAVVVYNLTNWYVPANTIGPVWKHNGKYYTNYDSAPLWTGAADVSGASSSSVTLKNFSEYRDSDIDTKYYGITLDNSTGRFKIRRSGEWQMTMSANLQLDSAVPSGQSVVAGVTFGIVSGSGGVGNVNLQVFWPSGAPTGSAQTATVFGCLGGLVDDEFLATASTTVGTVSVSGQVSISLQRLVNSGF